MGNKVKYNGKEFDGSNITINEDGVFIDGKKVDVEDMHFSTFTHETVTNHYYKKEDKKVKKKDWIWDLVKLIIASAVISNLMWGFSTLDDPVRNVDIITANLLAYLIIMKKNK
ncbi:hypothetical protein ACI3ER_11325 [Bacillus sp. Wb]